MTSSCDLVVVGAGPTGLALALQAAMMGVDVRVLERRSEPRAWAPALAIHPRTMEVLRGLDVADDLLNRGLSRVDLQIHVGESVASGGLGDLKLPSTEYPFVFFAPQPEVEAVLGEKLASFGVEVEWGGTFRGLQSHSDELVCRFEVGRRERHIRTRYLAGCDGADSSVREQAGFAFRGGSYRESISIADTGRTVGLESSTAHAFIGIHGIVFFFPLPSGRWRLIGPGVEDPTPDAVKTMVERHIGIRLEVSEIDWIRVVRPQHRLADHYRRGRVFLVGDAAHVHSPAGAQGMNTSIQDAVNLGWKLAMVLKGAPDALLDTYERERRPVAKHVMLLTGLAFALEVSKLAPLRWGRRWVAPPVARLLLPHPGIVSLFGRVASGLDTRYRHGAVEKTRRPDRYQPGRRLPDRVIGAGMESRVHRLIAGDRFNLLTFEDTVDLSHLDRLADSFASVLTRRHAGSTDGKAPTWALVRPDGYIAASGRDADFEGAQRYLRRWLGGSIASLRPRNHEENVAPIGSTDPGVNPRSLSSTKWRNRI